MPDNLPNRRRRTAAWGAATAAIAITVIVIGLRLKRDAPGGPPPTARGEPVAGPVPRRSPAGEPLRPPARPLLGEEILDGYAHPDHPPSRDLELVDRLLFSYRALVKNHTDRPVGTNADFVDVLLGNNPARQRFLPDGFAHLSPDGELLDRWGTPLFVHPEAADRIELRSAGPDRQLWTGDDLLRPAQ